MCRWTICCYKWNQKVSDFPAYDSEKKDNMNKIKIIIFYETLDIHVILFWSSTVAKLLLCGRWAELTLDYHPAIHNHRETTKVT